MNRLVVMSNRVPDQAGGAQAGGLAVALEALLRGRGGLWFGWSGRVAEQAAATPARRRDGCVEFATVDLTPCEHERYYNGFSNSVLWPLLHGLPDLMRFEQRSAQVYREVNARMADAVVPLLQPSDMIWVHDYHLMCMPALLRQRGVRAPIGFFLHIPFPATELLELAPDVGALLADLLEADLIGFQTAGDAARFAAAAQRLAGATRLSDSALQLGGRRIELGTFPVEIEPRAFAALAAEAQAEGACQRLRESLGSQALILGVDRLDPTKGLPQRLSSYRRLLQERPDLAGRTSFLQIAAASRQEVESYRALRTCLDQAAGAINGDLGTPDWTPLRFIARPVPRSTIAGYMRQAAVGLVTPLRDGMNLVAKEFVAAQNPDDPGALVLSRFAGAARQLSAAVLVNPHDPEGLTAGLARALAMPRAERRERWQDMWQAIEDRSALGWGRSFVASLLRTGLRSPARVELFRGRPAARPITVPEVLRRAPVAQVLPRQSLNG